MTHRHSTVTMRHPRLRPNAGRHDAITVAVNDERRYIHAAQILAEALYQVETQARLAVAEAPAARFQLARKTSSLTRVPRSTSVLKKLLKSDLR